MADPPTANDASPHGVESIANPNAIATDAYTTGKDANPAKATGSARRRREQRAQRMAAVRERLLEDNQRAL
jgi:hypothetical protein